MSNNIPKNTQSKWCVGIDFGTTNTYIVAYDQQKEKVYTNATEGVAMQLKDANNNIPTAITVGLIEEPTDKEPSEQALIGNQAIKKPVWRTFRDLKTSARTLEPPNGTFGEGEKPVEYPFRNCGLTASLQFGTDEYPIKKSVKDLLREYFQQILKALGINLKQVKELVVGQPAVNENNGTVYNYKDALEDIFTGILDKDAKVQILSEPELAGVTYLFGNNSDKTVLVIDIGGGTTDFSVLTYEKNEAKDDQTYNINCEIKDSCNIAGNAIDDLIMSLLPKDFRASKVLCRQAKEQCFGEDKSYSGHLGKYHDEDLHLQYDQGNLCIVGKDVARDDTSKKNIEKEIFAKIGATLKTVLDNFQKSCNRDINTIFFVGGSSAIEPLRTYLKGIVDTKFNCDVATETLFGNNQRMLAVPGDDDRPIKVTTYNAVAIGACIKACGYDCILQPGVKFSWNIPGHAEKDVSKRDVMIMGERKFIPICYYVYSKEKQNTFRMEENIIITWTIDGNEEHRYEIGRDIFKALGALKECKDLFFVLSMKQQKEVQFEIYSENKSKSPPPQYTSLSAWIDSNGLSAANAQKYFDAKHVIVYESQEGLSEFKEEM